MNRQQALGIARHCALASSDLHPYMPLNACEARQFVPHAWVLDAIEYAARVQSREESRTMTIPTIGRIVTVVGIDANGIDHHPAMITRAWSGSSTAMGPVAVNLTVFLDNREPACFARVMLFHHEEAARTHRYGKPGLPAAFWPVAP